jgi:hypothetical protein
VAGSSSRLLPGGEPIHQELQAHLPQPLLLLSPLVKGGVLPQPEAIEEGTAHQGQGALKLGDEGGALLKRRGRGVQLGLVVRLLHHVQVQLQRSLGVQAEGIMLTVQMGTTCSINRHSTR